MFARNAFATLLVVAAPFVVRADVSPSEPGPGDIFKVGETCHIAWGADTASTTIWKNMSIELMSGSNLGMNHITTVASGQDGTVSGTFDYTCPDVTPNSAIYFYQFSSPQTSTLTWTTRFTIASASGATTDPANTKQPSGDAIPWGTGALVDASTAVAAPVIGTTASGNSSASSAPPIATSASTTPSSVASTKSLTTIISSSTGSASASASSVAASQQTTAKSGAIAFGVDARLGLTAVAIVAAVLL